jgi:hypothetical protein
VQGVWRGRAYPPALSAREGSLSPSLHAPKKVKRSLEEEAVEKQKEKENGALVCVGDRSGRAVGRPPGARARGESRAPCLRRTNEVLHIHYSKDKYGVAARKCGHPGWRWGLGWVEKKFESEAPIF